MEFHYVTYEQLSNLESSHPQVLSVFTADTRLFYSSCPDMSADFPVFFYLSEDEKVVSQIGTIPDVMTDAEGCLHRWAWSGGLVTKPEFRGRGGASYLLREMMAVLKEKQILRGSVYSAHESLYIYKKIGGTIIGYAQRYLLLKSVRPVLRRYVGNGYFMSFVDFLYGLSYLTVVRFVLKVRSKYAKFRVKKLSGEECTKSDVLKCVSENIFSFNSTTEKLLWKLSRAKNEPELFVVYDDANKYVGYFIMRNKYVNFDKNEPYSDYNLMTLMDFGCCADDMEKGLEAIFEKVVFMFFESEVDVLEVISSSDHMISYAKKTLLIRGGRGMSFTFSPFDAFDMKEVADLKRWHLTSFCGDAFTYK